MLIRHFGIFAKYWQPGSVKTRLAQSIGPIAASEIYRKLVVTLLRRMNHVANQHVLAVTPADKIQEFQRFAGSDWQLVSQASGDLGARMATFFEQCFQAGAHQAVLIGSDSPTLPVAYIRDAFELLQQHDAVLGPSDVGGYYLVGAAGRVPPIFQDITWSSPHVLEQTTRRLEQADLSFATLPTWYDVDDLDGLRRLQQELRELISIDTDLADLLAAIDASLS